MTQNPNYATVRDGKVVSEDHADEPVPGPSQGVNDSTDEVPSKPLHNMTHAELDAYAAAQEPPVDLTGATTRDDKIDAIKAAQADSGQGGGDGSGQ